MEQITESQEFKAFFSDQNKSSKLEMSSTTKDIPQIAEEKRQN